MTKPVCKLLGEDGNIFNLMGIAARTLRNANQQENAEKLISEVEECNTYDDAICVIMKYVEVE